MTFLSSEYREKKVASIIKAIGVERVRIADKNDMSSDMYFRVAEYLIQQEHIDKNEIDGLVFVSQTVDHILPSTSIILQERPKLNKDVICLDIYYGCPGYIYGIFQAALWVTSEACRNVLVLAGDTTSHMIHPKDKLLRMVSGDYGITTLVTIGKSSLGVTLHSDGAGHDRLIVRAGGFRDPVSEETSLL